MFLLTRPPILRWVAAVGLVMVAMWADLRPPELGVHPFLVVDVAAGDTIEEQMVEMRAVVPGTFEAVELPAVAGRPGTIGDPVLETALAEQARQPIPDGWLLVELAVPAGAEARTDVVVVVSREGAAPQQISGIVVETGIDDGRGGEAATCAFPPEEAALVAVAISEQRASVLVGT